MFRIRKISPFSGTLKSKSAHHPKNSTMENNIHISYNKQSHYMAYKKVERCRETIDISHMLTNYMTKRLVSTHHNTISTKCNVF